MALSIKKNILWIIIIVLIILNIISLVSLWITNEPRRDYTVRKERRADRGIRFLKEELNFGPEQEAEFDSLLTLHRTSMEGKVEEIRIVRRQLMGMMQNQEFTEEAESLVHQIGEIQAELELMNFRHFRNVMSICDEEQKQVFKETVLNAVGPRHFRDGRGPRGPGWRDGR